MIVIQTIQRIRRMSVANPPKPQPKPSQKEKEKKLPPWLKDKKK